MLELLKTELSMMQKTVTLIEEAESSLPHQDSLRNLIAFLKNLENTIQGQVEILEEELKGFNDGDNKN